ncbi:unnamed protein product [Peniophora sp. CBMAI 1063]|nr:unnamed protein product [Peniophora sp. CBMAI 1063]
MAGSSSQQAVGLPRTGRRAASARGYAEDRPAGPAVMHDVQQTKDGGASTTAVHIPPTSVDQLEGTLPPSEQRQDRLDETDEAMPPNPPEQVPDLPEGTTPAQSLPRKNFPGLYFLKDRMIYLWALLRLDGRPSEVVDGEIKGCARDDCPRSGDEQVMLYRCTSGCMSCEWICASCMASEHQQRPLDRIEMWVGGEWQPSTLRGIGARAQFGHLTNTKCRLKHPSMNDFVVIHTNGIHEVAVDFCACNKLKRSVVDQLMAGRWYPATGRKPLTAATYEVLDAFNAHSGMGKDNAYDFYNALVTLTDGAGLFNVPDRLKQFFQMAHEYRHLLASKRGGRGHEAKRGIEHTKKGTLAILCAACAHEGINTDIVEALRKISPELAAAADKFNNVVQLSMDCNFRAKNRMTRSTAKTSPYYGNGMAYMVPESLYETFTSTSPHTQELGNCSRFGAQVLANLKAGKGLRTTGVGAVFCSRHKYFWPNTVGTLVKGERYCTMDFIFASAVRRVRASSLHVFYDIICQYTRKLNMRMMTVPPKSFVGVGAEKLLHRIDVAFGVPKFHNPGHLLSCQLWFNISYMRYAGMTDGEASERAWAGLNPAASSLREMGPGTMRDTIDFYCGVWNWRKFVNTGSFLARKMERALKEAREHCEIYNGLHGAVRRENPAMCDAWVHDCEAFEDRKHLDELGRPIVKGPEAVSNPYESRSKKQSLEKARLESLKIASEAEDAEEPVNAGSSQEAQAAALTNFVLRGFKIEVMNWRERRAKVARTVMQRSEEIQRRSDVVRQMRLFRKDQQWMMPIVFAAIQELEGVEPSRQGGSEDADVDDEGASDDEAQTSAQETPKVTDATSEILYLPSELGKDVARSPNVVDVFFEELKLRYAGMEDWLNVLRQQLRCRATVDRWKVDYVTGQDMSSRARTKQETIQANVLLARDMYRLHRERYVTLVSFLTEDEQKELVPEKWEITFKILNDNDCRPLNNRLLLAIDDTEIEYIRQIIEQEKNKRKDPSGQSHHRIPWIWFHIAENTELELNDDMRVEFAKCRARAMRWVEEVYIVAYEMMRVPEFCRARQAVWEERIGQERSDIDRYVKDGVDAYARKQATIFRRHAEGLQDLFKGPLEQAAEFARFHGLDGMYLKRSESE